MIAAVTTMVLMMYEAPFLLKLLMIEDIDDTKAMILMSVIKIV